MSTEDQTGLEIEISARGARPRHEAPGHTAPDAAQPATPAPGELTEAQLEALLFVAEKPLARSEIAALAGVDRDVVDARVGDLAVNLAQRGIRLVESGEKVELATAPEAGVLIARYVGADAPRLSSASLETLAIVAYRQPCTRATVERIRGVDSDYTIRTLLHRRLVVELGRSEAPGRPSLFGTGFDFLERFGMTSLDELPPLEAGRRRAAVRAGARGGGCAGRGRAAGRGRLSYGARPRSEDRGRGRACLAPRSGGVDQGRAGDRRRQDRDPGRDGRPGHAGGRGRRHATAVGGDAARLLDAQQAGRGGIDGARSACRQDGDGSSAAQRPAGGAPLPGGAPGRGLGGAAPLHQRRRRGRTCCSIHATAWSGSTWSAWIARCRRARRWRCAKVSSWRKAWPGPTCSRTQLRPRCATCWPCWPRLTPQLRWYRVVLAQGWKRQIRRMFTGVEVPVRRLVRVRIGSLKLTELPAGQARPLDRQEIRRLAAGARRTTTTRPRRAGSPPTDSLE